VYSEVSGAASVLCTHLEAATTAFIATRIQAMVRRPPDTLIVIHTHTHTQSHMQREGNRLKYTHALIHRCVHMLMQ
jgi:hypothetical protein